jgi:RNA polymerase-binding protein DksA
MMVLVDSKALTERLLEERERVLSEISELDEDLSKSLEESSGESPHDQHMAENATATLGREIDLTLQDNAKATLIKIDRAMHKLEDGTYGQCDKCGKPIGAGRLEIAPYSTLCVDCKRLDERNL